VPCALPARKPECECLGIADESALRTIYLDTSRSAMKPLAVCSAEPPWLTVQFLFSTEHRQFYRATDSGDSEGHLSYLLLPTALTCLEFTAASRQNVDTCRPHACYVPRRSSRQKVGACRSHACCVSRLLFPPSGHSEAPLGGLFPSPRHPSSLTPCPQAPAAQEEVLLSALSVDRPRFTARKCRLEAESCE
jgi:hypothetical protein